MNACPSFSQARNASTSGIGSVPVVFAKVDPESLFRELLGDMGRVWNDEFGGGNYAIFRDPGEEACPLNDHTDGEQSGTDGHRDHRGPDGSHPRGHASAADRGQHDRSRQGRTLPPSDDEIDRRPRVRERRGPDTFEVRSEGQNAEIDGEDQTEVWESFRAARRAHALPLRRGEADGAVWLEAWAPGGMAGTGRRLFRTQIQGPDPERIDRGLPADSVVFPDVRDSVVVTAPNPSYSGSALTRFLFGRNYRRAWDAPVPFPVLDLGREAGG